MKITSKFNVGDLTKTKYDLHGEEGFIVLEIIQINTETCYSATQIFYLCRMWQGRKIVVHPDKKFKWAISHHFSKDDYATGYKKYREDELVVASKAIIDLMKKHSTY